MLEPIIKFGFRMMWRIIQISEAVIHRQQAPPSA